MKVNAVLKYTQQNLDGEGKGAGEGGEVEGCFTEDCLLATKYETNLIDNGFHWDEVTSSKKLQGYKMNQQNKLQN